MICKTVNQIAKSPNWYILSQQKAQSFYSLWKSRQFASIPDSNNHVVIGDSAWRTEQGTESIPSQ